ncbi:ABC transporter ATP-binding protein, partial [Pimelobacter simplex]
GHALVTVFGRRRAVEAEFDAANEELYQSSYRAQFISGLVMPMMMLIGNLNYVVIAVVGGLRVASGSLSLGE